MTVVADPAAPTPAVADAPRLGPPWTRARAGLWLVAIVFAVLAAWSFWSIGANPFTLWVERDDVGNLLTRMWPPRIERFGRLWKAVQETFYMAFLGTVLAVVLAIPVGFAAARNVMPWAPARFVARGLIVAARAIPDLVFALIFLRVWSIGPLAGVVALGVHSVGMLGKLFADAIEQIEPGPREGVAATGASRSQEVLAGILPQVVPAFIAAAMYRLDINFRSATILGFVGAGGMGHYINQYKGSLRYPEMLGLTLLVIALVLAMEAASAGVRGVILGQRRTPSWLTAGRAVGAEGSRPGERRLTPPWTFDRTAMYAFGAVCAGLLALASVATDISFGKFFDGLPKLHSTLWRFVPKNLDWWLPRFWGDFRETVQIGFAASLLALVLALPVGLLAARNVAPARWVYYVARAIVLLLRALPELVIAVIFVAALGLGPKPGVLALSVGTFAFGAKLFADAIEEVSEGPRDGVRAVGATRLQESSASVLSQAMPALVGNTLYMLDVAIRSSTVLGIVGAGGIGYPLLQANKSLRFEQVGGIVICMFLIVGAIELVATWVRKRII